MVQRRTRRFCEDNPQPLGTYFWVDPKEQLAYQTD